MPADKKVHNVVGCVISADPWWKPKILLVRRNTAEQGEKYWPGRWCYLTEHIEPGEKAEDALSRCLQEELGLKGPKYILKGPVHIALRDPDHQELFKIRLFQCMLTGLEDRMDIDPQLNYSEASRWIWTSTLSPFYTDAAIRSDPVFEHLRWHLDLLYRSPMVFSPGKIK
jgi:ADP-ribose pyrophosphatase YjhB (NUDIX family)